MEAQDEIVALRDRIEILSGVLSALGRMDEINRTVRRCSDRIEARRALREEPFGYSERVATHILDLSVSRQTKEGIEELRRERQQAVDRLQTLGE